MNVEKVAKRLFSAVGITVLATCLYSSGVMADINSKTILADKQIAEKKKNILKGKVTGISKKAKTITVTAGKGDKAKILMVKFNGDTKGMENVKKGRAIIANFDIKGTDRVATIIKPKLVKLPKGVSEIRSQELIDIITNKPYEFLLVDARPASRFAEGHLPGAISIPVEKMKTKKGINILPTKKDIPIITYCGGPT